MLNCDIKRSQQASYVTNLKIKFNRDNLKILKQKVIYKYRIKKEPELNNKKKKK